MPRQRSASSAAAPDRPPAPRAAVRPADAPEPPAEAVVASRVAAAARAAARICARLARGARVLEVRLRAGPLLDGRHRGGGPARAGVVRRRTGRLLILADARRHGGVAGRSLRRAIDARRAARAASRVEEAGDAAERRVAAAGARRRAAGGRRWLARAAPADVARGRAVLAGRAAGPALRVDVAGDADVA